MKLMLGITLLLLSPALTQTTDSAHSVQFVSVEKDVRLEVLDWGGTGRPLVLLAGLGNDADVFDKFAPKLTTKYHVYGITRRGFGASSHPAPTSVNYAADRLGDDVLAVINSLNLNKPVLIGHSIAGEELSSVGSRHPEKVAGLVYLDAGYGYAYYSRSSGDIVVDVSLLQKKLELLKPGKMPQDSTAFIGELLDKDLPALEKDLQRLQKAMQDQTLMPSAPMPPVVQAVMDGVQKYADIHVPVLAIFALPHDFGPVFLKSNPAARAAAEARDAESTEAQAKAFEDGIRSARVIRLPHATHYVFRSNEADVLREINEFVGKLPE